IREGLNMVDTLIVENAHQAATQLAEERRNLYGLLALIYAKEPSYELLQYLREPLLLQALEEIDSEISCELKQIPDDKLMRDMVIEYTRLFLGPGKHISPHESVYVSGFGSAGAGSKGQLWGEATVQVQEQIEGWGFNLGDTQQRIPDHIAVEMELMYHLTGKETESWAAGEVEEARKYQQQQKKFLEEHLCRWVENFCNLVEDQSDSRFYRGIAGITRQFILSEPENLSVAHDWGC
ncbi:MAG: TorD/DmsD family molecular chaperone, partial [Bacillota bacterium]